MTLIRPLCVLAATSLTLAACSWPIMRHKASAEDVAAARASQPGPLPSPPGICKAVVGSPVCCVGANGSGPAIGTCTASADACMAAGGKVADAPLSGCA